MSVTNQNTIKSVFSLSGKGLHFGKEATVVFKPAKADTGYVIVRVDLDGNPEIKVLSDNVQLAERASCLEKDGIQVYTLEHAISALYGCGIDNCVIELNCEEFPILDGSSKSYVNEINRVGIESLDAERQYFEVKEKIEYYNKEANTRITLLPDDKFSITSIVSYDSPYLSMQYASFSEGEDDYATEIAPSRTFVFLREVEMLLDNNLIKGGDLDNAIVIVDREISKEEAIRLGEKFGYKNIEIHKGVLNNLKLQFENEPARHKLLDIIGDIALCGRFIKGKIIAERPGHKANAAIAKMVRKKIMDEYKENICPHIDDNTKILIDINGIRSLLPHRPPFLLVDRIYKFNSDMIIGSKNVTMDEPFFVGHFPEEPVMPGVLIVEAMAQCGGILVLKTVPDPENYSTYFMKMDRIKFRKKVVPGDPLLFKLRIISPIRRGIVVMKGCAFVRGKLVCEGELMAQVAKNNK